MIRAAGDFRYRVTIQRRAVVANTQGKSEGDFAPVPGLERISAAYREMSMRQIAMGGASVGAVDGEMFLRDFTLARSITTRDRVVIEGVGFSIISVGVPDRERAEIRFMLKKDRG